MGVREPRTIAETIDVCRERLRSVSPTPWLDARLLAQFVTGLDASALVAYGDADLDRSRREKLLQLAERRLGGEPVAYLVGKKSFCGLELQVDKRVLVPRPETEELVLACVAEWTGRTPAIVDIGTGSGAIACALAHLLPGAPVVAADASDPALDVARVNTAALGLGEQISCIHSDLFAAFDPALQFDVLIANLPYVGTDHLHQLAAGVQQHEPALALLAGPDGLDLYRRLFNEAPQRMRPGGAIYCECSPDNALQLAALVQSAFPAGAVEVRKDLAGLDRMVIARLPGPA